jgi:hypothetical protein
MTNHQNHQNQPHHAVLTDRAERAWQHQHEDWRARPIRLAAALRRLAALCRPTALSRPTALRGRLPDRPSGPRPAPAPSRQS